MSESAFLGPNLTPPRGGLLRLQETIDKQTHHRFHVRTWLAAGVTASLAAVSLVFFLHGAIKQHRMDVAVRRALTAPPQTYFANSAYVKLPSRHPNVQILLIGSLPSQQPPTQDVLAD